MTDTNLPVVPGQPADAAVRGQGPGAPATFRDAVSDLRHAWDAVRQFDENGVAGDVSAVLQATVVCAGANGGRGA